MRRLSMGAPKTKKRRGLNIAAIPNCEFWVDLARADTLTFASGVNVQSVRDLSGKNRHMTKTGAGNDTVYPTYVAAENGLQFINTVFDQMIAGAAGDWNFMHNGAGCSIFFVVKITSDYAANGVIMATSSEASTGIGTNIWYQNTNQNLQIVTRNGASQVFVTNAAANSLQKDTVKLMSVHINNRPGQPADLITRTNGATDLQAQSLSGTFAQGNATGTLFIGKLPDSTFKAKMVLKKVAIFSRRLSKAEENLILEDWARAENITLTRYGEHPLLVLAGQSNAKGRGAQSESGFTAGNATVTNAKIFNSTAYTWSTLQAGVNNDAFNTSSIGIEMNVAKEFTTLSNQMLGIVKYAADGTAINSWMDPNSNFTNTRDAIIRAIWSLEDAGYVAKPVGFIWYQGESDAFTAEDAVLYETKLKNFLNQFNSVNGFAQTPVYVVQIQQNPPYPGTAIVQQAGLTVSLTSPYSAYVRYVETGDIAVNSDVNHINAVSLNAIGRRIARRIVGVAE